MSGLCVASLDRKLLDVQTLVFCGFVQHMSSDLLVQGSAEGRLKPNFISVRYWTAKQLIYMESWSTSDTFLESETALFTFKFFFRLMVIWKKLHCDHK